MYLRSGCTGVSNPAGFQNRFGARTADVIIVFITTGSITSLFYDQFYIASYTLIDLLGIGMMLLRNVVAGVAYTLTLGVGLIVSAFMMGIREDKRSIHDFLAGMYVTYDSSGKP